VTGEWSPDQRGQWDFQSCSYYGCRGERLCVRSELDSEGRLGDGTTTDRALPARVGTQTWRTVSPGGGHTLGIQSNGTLWAWGRNDTGQAGDGTQESRHSPVQIGTSSDWAAVSAGYEHSLALKTDGSLWMWGSNLSGQLNRDTLRTVGGPAAATNWGARE
jgi:alpha-tubulin suppressor-like RCC1 family protein